MKKLTTVSVLTLTLTFSGCASNGGMATSANNGCSAGVSSAVGMLLGAAAGYAASKNNGNTSAQNNRAIAVGALAGGALAYGACIAINDTIRKKTDAQVKQEYQQKYGALPVQTKIEKYTTSLGAGNTIRSGQKTQVLSDIYIVEGLNDPLKTVQETIALKNDSGAVLKQGVKDMKQTDGNSGEFGNSFTLTFPSDAKGNYTIETGVLINGNKVAKSSKPITLI